MDEKAFASLPKEMQDYINQLKAERDKAVEENNTLRSAVAVLSKEKEQDATLKQHGELIQELRNEVKDARTESQELRNELNDVREEYQKGNKALETAVEELKEKNQILAARVDNLETENTSLKTTVEKQVNELVEVREENKVLAIKVDSLEAENKDLKAKIETLDQQYTELLDFIEIVKRNNAKETIESAEENLSKALKSYGVDEHCHIEVYTQNPFNPESFIQNYTGYTINNLDINQKNTFPIRDSENRDKIIGYMQVSNVGDMPQKKLDGIIQHEHFSFSIAQNCNKIYTDMVASIDPLMGIFSASKYKEYEQKDYLLDKAAGPLSIIGIDGDKFKELNNYGHAVGDAALRLYADALRECSREGETILFRKGGDELCVAFKGTAEDATVFALRVQEYIRCHPLDITYEKDGQKYQAVIGTSLTAGIVQMKPDETFEEAFKRADKLEGVGKESFETDETGRSLARNVIVAEEEVMNSEKVQKALTLYTECPGRQPDPVVLDARIQTCSSPMVLSAVAKAGRPGDLMKLRSSDISSVVQVAAAIYGRQEDLDYVMNHADNTVVSHVQNIFSIEQMLKENRFEIHHPKKGTETIELIDLDTGTVERFKNYEQAEERLNLREGYGKILDTLRVDFPIESYEERMAKNYSEELFCSYTANYHSVDPNNKPMEILGKDNQEQPIPRTFKRETDKTEGASNPPRPSNPAKSSGSNMEEH